MTRKVLYVTGTRADYGLMRSALKAIAGHPGLELELAVTGMHLMPEFGLTVEEVRRDGYPLHVVEAVYERDSKESMAAFTGECVRRLSALVGQLRPDFILLLGDRGEMLAGAIVGAYMSVPVAHVHGGEITSTVDDHVRHAITRLAHVHFAATPRSAERLVRMGEAPERVFLTGAPGLDPDPDSPAVAPAEVRRRYGLEEAGQFLLVVQHAVTLEAGEAACQMRQTLEAVAESGLQAIVVYPNADAGGREIIKVIREYEGGPRIRACASIPRADFLALLAMTTAIVGNSSSGLIEAPAYGVPAVNVGSRQRGREASENVLCVGYEKEEIASAIRRAAEDTRFKALLGQCQSPYGTGGAGRKIAEVLASVAVDENLLQKKWRD